VRFAQHQRALHRRHLDLLRILAHDSNERYPTLWLDLPDPVAYSVAGHPSLVVASNGLRARLSGEAVAAVLAHEKAHLRGRHHLLVGLAEAVARALPWLPLNTVQNKTPLRLALAATALAGAGLLGAGVAVAADDTSTPAPVASVAAQPAEPDGDSGDTGTEQQGPMGEGMDEMMQAMSPEMRERMQQQCQSGMQEMMSDQDGIGGMGTQPGGMSGCSARLHRRPV
jgi:hypothetical protein